MTNKDLYGGSYGSIFEWPIDYILSGAKIVENKLPDKSIDALKNRNKSNFLNSLSSSEVIFVKPSMEATCNFIINDGINITCQWNGEEDTIVNLNNNFYCSSDCINELDEFDGSGESALYKSNPTITLDDIYNNPDKFQKTIAVLEYIKSTKSLLDGIVVYKIDDSTNINGIEDAKDILYELFVNN